MKDKRQKVSAVPWPALFHPQLAAYAMLTAAPFASSDAWSKAFYPHRCRLSPLPCYPPVFSALLVPPRMPGHLDEEKSPDTKSDGR